MSRAEDEDNANHDEGESEPLYQVESPESQVMQVLSREGHTSEVAEFARTNNLMHKLDVFERASALLQSDVLIEEIPGITPDEVIALQGETEHKWAQPKMLYFVIAACSIAAIEQGWAQTSMNGANLYIPKVFGIDSGSPRDAFILGLINSGIYISTAILGAWISSPINDQAGRRGAVFVGSLLCLISNIASALSRNWPMLVFFRFVLGLGLGIDASTASVYAAECAPALIRGGLAVSWQMFCAFGIFLGFVANAAVYNFGQNTWRLQLAAPLVPTIPLLLMLFACPESPAWYLKRGSRYDLAFQSLRRLRNSEIQAAKELYATYLQRQLKQETLKMKPHFGRRLLELVTIPRIRRATMASYAVMLSQQLCEYLCCTDATFGSETQLTCITWVRWHQYHRLLFINHLFGRRLLHFRRPDRLLRVRLRQLPRSISRRMDHGHSWATVVAAPDSSTDGADHVCRWSQLQHSG